MKAVTWQGKRDVQVKEMPDPKIEEPTDVVIRVTSTAICGSDLHLYEVLAPYMHQDDILGHEPMGIVEQVGDAVTHVQPGDRVVIPFNISCGHCFMCDRGLFSQCETTQVRSEGKGAALLGYTQLYGRVPGGQARVPAGPAGPLRPDQGLERGTGREVPVPLRRAAHRVAGRRVRRPRAGRHGRRLRARTDRADGRPHRAAQGRLAGHRRSTPWPSAAPWPRGTASRRSTRPRWTTSRVR